MASASSSARNLPNELTGEVCFLTIMGAKAHSFEANAMLKVSKSSEDQIGAFFLDAYGMRPNRLKSNLHLTVYYGRRPLPGLRQACHPVRIIADTDETRFMILAPGGENPRPELDPRALSVGIRVTRRNRAVADIQELRQSVYRFETLEVIGKRKATMAWTNCFGSRHYQPHIQLLRPWHKIDSSLARIGSRFRSEIDYIEFDHFQIEFRHRVDDEWVVASRTTSGATRDPTSSTQKRPYRKGNL